MKKVLVGSRESKLAIVQAQIIVEQILENYKDIDINLITMKTKGDKIVDRKLEEIGGKGVFIKELEQALLDKRVDFCVHSLKDMPMEIMKEIPIVAFSKREDPRDVLILPKDKTQLEKGKPLGCSSLRRVTQLKILYPDMECKPIRGNILSRLEKLDNGEYSGLILAYAGIKRLGLENRIYKIFTIEEIIPAAGQGILAIQGREGEDYFYLDCIINKEATYEAIAERSFVNTLNGGCFAPIAAYAKVYNNKLDLLGFYYNDKKNQSITKKITGSIGEAKELGQKLAEKFIEIIN